MFGRSFPTQRKGEPIKASTINAGLDAARGFSRLRVGAGLTLKTLGGAPLIALASAAFGAEIGQAGASIPGRITTQLGSGTVTIHDVSADGLMTASSRTVTAWNLSASSIASGVYLLLLRVGPLRIVIWEECP